MEQRTSAIIVPKTRFTILLPVLRPPAMLPYAIESVLAQELDNFELLVIGDGAPAETIECAMSFASRDRRIKVFPFPKGAMCGEEHRHTVLADATSEYIAHIGDDDLWFPNHLVELQKLLQQVDFGHLIHVYAEEDETFDVLPSDLTNDRLRNRILTEVFNTLGDTVTGYRLAAYRSLSEGWAPPPEIANPDLKMWRKFLCRDDLMFGTRAVVTALNFATDRRRHMTLEDRRREIEKWWRRIMDPVTRAEIAEGAWRALSGYAVRSDQQGEDRLGVIHELRNRLERLEGLLDHRLPIGGTIDFSATGNSPLFLISGWSFQDPGSRWSDGHEAIIKVRLEFPAGDTTSWIGLRCHAYAFGRPQRVLVQVDDAATIEITVNEFWGDFDIPIVSAMLLPGKEHRITFHLPDAHSPKSAGQGEDARNLGICVSSMTFVPRTP